MRNLPKSISLKYQNWELIQKALANYNNKEHIFQQNLVASIHRELGNNKREDN